MSITNGFAIITVPSGGGTVDLNDYAPFNRFIVVSSGAVTLSSSFTITHTSPATNYPYEVYWRADVDPDGNTVTILGKTVEELQADDAIGLYVGLYDGSSFSSFQGLDYATAGFVTTDKIADDAVTAAKIAAGAIDIAALDNTINLRMITQEVSFETDEQGAGYVRYIPWKCDMIRTRSVVTKDLAATDAGEIAIAHSGGTPTGAPSNPISFPASSPIGTSIDTTWSGSVEIPADGALTATTSKVTAGGKVTMTHVVRLKA